MFSWGSRWIDRLYYVGFIALVALSGWSVKNETAQWNLRANIQGLHERLNLQFQLEVFLQRTRASVGDSTLFQDGNESLWMEQQLDKLVTTLQSEEFFTDEEADFSQLRNMLKDWPQKMADRQHLPARLEMVRAELSKIENRLDEKQRSLESEIQLQDEALARFHVRALALNSAILGAFLFFLWVLVLQSSAKSRLHSMLDASEKLHRLIFSSLEEAIVLCTKEGRISVLNDRARKILPFHIKDIRGEKVLDQLPTLHTLEGEELDPTKSELVDLLRGSRYGRDSIYGFQQPKGGYRWLRFRSHHLMDPHGRSLDSVLLSATDITDSIEKERLIQKQRAEMANKTRLSALGEIASGLAHEINNPLAQMMFEAEIFQSSLLPEKAPSSEQVKGFAERVTNSAKRVSRIIKGIRLYARDGETDEFQTESLRKIVDDALLILNHRRVELQVEFLLESLDSKLEIYCRPTQILQLLVNLLANAIDAIELDPQENNWIRIASQIENGNLILAVSNSGPTIPAQVRPRLFQAFFSTKGPHRGSGLGLSISRQIAQAHGGDLWLSPDAKSTEFIVRIPLKSQVGTAAA